MGSATTLSATVSTGSDVIFIWNFGDGVSDTGQVVSHSYAAAGTYTATVTATNAVNSDTATTIIIVAEAITGLAADNDSPTALDSPTTLNATVSAGSDVVFTWDLGDGTSGAGQVVSHIYPAPGTYTAVVTATNAVDADAATTLVTVVEPITGLTAGNDSPTPLGSATPLSATISTGSDVVFTWDFGDGTGDTGQVVSHSYGANGVYTATVTASNGVGSDTATTIVIVAEAITGLAIDNDSPTPLGSPTNLSATVGAGSNVSYVWDFGDGVSGSGQVVSHTYAAPGVYIAMVTAINAVDADAVTTFVTVVEPITGLAADNDSPTPIGSPTTLSATVSAGSNVSYVWDFGDGVSGSGQVVSHTYGAAGAYTATVTATNAVDTDTTTTFVTIDRAREAILRVNPSTVTMPGGTTEVVTITVTPGSALVNGVQIHGRIDPTYLRLIRVQPVVDTLPHVLDPVSFDPATGIFRYGAGILSGVITKPFAILALEIEAVAATTITGTEVAFLFDFPPTDISGLSGSVLDEVQNGRVMITPAAALQATLNLQGRPADKSEPAWAIPLTVTLTEIGQETSRTFTPTTAQGRFTLPFIKPGLYDIR
jgi:PKD repeat protein